MVKAMPSSNSHMVLKRLLQEAAQKQHNKHCVMPVHVAAECWYHYMHCSP